MRCGAIPSQSNRSETSRGVAGGRICVRYNVNGTIVTGAGLDRFPVLEVDYGNLVTDWNRAVPVKQSVRTYMKRYSKKH